MFANLEPISVDSVTFFALAGGLAVIAWWRGQRFFLPALAAAGVVLILSWLDWKDLLAMALFLPVPYFAARRLWGRKHSDAGTAIAAVIVWQVILFLIIKRYSWFDVLGWLDNPVTVIGVSYILFRQIHLVVDSRFLGHLPFSALRYIGYILLPWTIIAGPIQRYDTFCVGLDQVGRPKSDQLLVAAHRIINGLLLAFVVAPIFLEPSSVSNLTHANATWVDFLVVFYGFPTYLYLNFSGYTSIMIGASHLCGYTTLPENFNHPYLAVNTRDFWNRWHISFGAWIKIYVFTPVCAYLMKATTPRYHWIMMLVAVLVAFYVVGIWHGTTINYLIFGVLQGVGVVISALFEHMRKHAWGANRSREFNEVLWFRAASTLVTLHFTCFSFMLLNDHPDRLVEGIRAFFG
ncbi:MAG: MBOAT family O-acyltransferase [Pseudomonadota bacterium]|nr:MBOAT family O-acyltransferase [Pseudomonadota bacterium]